MTRPACPCHGEPMYRNGVRRGKQQWRCVVTRDASAAKRYYALEGVAWNHRLLQLRRNCALRRRAARKRKEG